MPMENVVSSALVAIVIIIIGGLLKQSLLNLSVSLKENTEALQDLNTTTKVHETEIKAIREILEDHKTKQTKFENNIDELRGEVSNVKSEVKILFDRERDKNKIGGN